MKPSDQISAMWILFASNDDRREAVFDLACRVEKLEFFARDIRDNYEHDSDNHDHAHSATCRVCLARNVLNETGCE